MFASEPVLLAFYVTFSLSYSPKLNNLCGYGESFQTQGDISFLYINTLHSLPPDPDTTEGK